MESKVYDKAYKFAIRIVKGYKYLCETKQEYILSKQLLRSGTSIGANIAEANGAIYQADFRAKMSIAYRKFGSKTPSFSIAEDGLTLLLT